MPNISYLALTPWKLLFSVAKSEYDPKAVNKPKYCSSHSLSAAAPCAQAEPTKGKAKLRRYMVSFAGSLRHVTLWFPIGSEIYSIVHVASSLWDPNATRLGKGESLAFEHTGAARFLQCQHVLVSFLIQLLLFDLGSLCNLREVSVFQRGVWYLSLTTVNWRAKQQAEEWGRAPLRISRRFSTFILQGSSLSKGRDTSLSADFMGLWRPST